jgi:hypothetical protein
MEYLDVEKRKNSVPSLDRILYKQRVPLFILWKEYLHHLSEKEYRFKCLRCGPCKYPPYICIYCGEQYCGGCMRKHEQGHWREEKKRKEIERQGEIPF